MATEGVSKLRPRVISIRRYSLVLLLALLASLMAFLVLTSTGHAIMRAGLLVLDFLPQSPISPLRTFTSSPKINRISFLYNGGEAEGRLYLPAGNGPHSAIILALGYGPNPFDPQLIRLSESLARLGIIVLIPDTPGLQAGNLVFEDAEILIGAFQYLSAQPYVNPDHIGFAGFCIGSSMALVAAEDPRINQQVSFINVFGGYYDAKELVRTVAARSARYNGQEFTWTPARQTVILLAQNLLTHLDTPQDRRILRQRLQPPIQASSTASSELTPWGQLTLKLLTNFEPVTVDALLTEIPAHKMSELKRISPSSNIDRLKAKVFIMHDLSDPYIPVIETYRLNDAISDPDQKVYMQFILFEHVRPTNSLNRLEFLKEATKLFIYICKLMIHITV